MDARKKRVVWVLGALAMLGAIALGLAWWFHLGDYVKRALDYVRNEGALVYFLAMAVLPFIGFPVSVFILSAGPLFAPTMGPGWVIVCALSALAFNIAISYWFAAVALRPWMERALQWLGYPAPTLAKGKSWEFTLLLRLVPGIPFFVQNYLLGLARVHFGIYLFVSLVVPTTHLMIAVLAGDALAQGDKGKLFLAFGLFGAVCLGLHFLRKHLARKRALTRSADDAEKPLQTGA